ncbi:DUF6428 family protein [Mucilaginibacter sp. FT3.2]|uniref:DUF6428 family protein n=1 Tax=Mucilaginibacter sp. FT3.2 TaxID=2723090 RepID=UPI00160B07CF|nr:DUF6428 family protein [Mucilaginibacter sp. FT3.2]MBB6235021.1 hypothetical protein [Mucilaginibacter sp. FT3.2]
MNDQKAINWMEFKEQLLLHPQLNLQFQYAENQWVDAAYHITEIKQAPITSVDCGGKMNSWTEVILQLWEPIDQQQDRAMQVNKALSIIQLVEKTLPLNPLAIVKIEFGNSAFDTRQMHPNQVIVNGNDLIIDLRPDTVQCKAIERGGNCGTTATGEECCVPVAAKPKIELKNLAATAECCTPGGGCC